MHSLLGPMAAQAFGPPHHPPLLAQDPLAAPAAIAQWMPAQSAFPPPARPAAAAPSAAAALATIGIELAPQFDPSLAVFAALGVGTAIAAAQQVSAAAQQDPLAEPDAPLALPPPPSPLAAPAAPLPVLPPLANFPFALASLPLTADFASASAALFAAQMQLQLQQQDPQTQTLQLQLHQQPGELPAQLAAADIAVLQDTLPPLSPADPLQQQQQQQQQPLDSQPAVLGNLAIDLLAAQIVLALASAASFDQQQQTLQPLQQLQQLQLLQQLQQFQQPPHGFNSPLMSELSLSPAHDFEPLALALDDDVAAMPLDVPSLMHTTSSAETSSSAPTSPASSINFDASPVAIKREASSASTISPSLPPLASSSSSRRTARSKARRPAPSACDHSDHDHDHVVRPKVVHRHPAPRRVLEPESFKFSCTMCDRVFTRKYNLDSHILMHQNIKPFKCTHPGCSEAFVRKYDLKRHVRTLHDQDLYGPCPGCQRKYTRVDAFRKHVKACHPYVDPDDFLHGVPESKAALHGASASPEPSYMEQ
ncbi:hypothetical protein HK105_207829 [Polyrhizophydium stewartii]|uniref:C2H2-type domain-containing protein n=1 Tax=Polyrhizophydium stewartii TaxID=2732419 RepID=A0ABR4MZV8_9FUNG